MTPAGRTMLAAAVLAVEAISGWWVAFLLTLLAVAGVWLYRLRRHPQGPCFACHGRRGQNAGSDEHQWGDCGLCGGSGQRTRFGARLVRRGK